ncbi:MAG: nickel pincer cofactor biosynthesis protein LarC [Planctomycetales bacterium]|nr:nickel pincer cofactor biosynthesis protein LarC [Planctomycetales bacterium]
MKIAYLDCASGISGDMTLGALVDAGAPLADVQAGVDSLGLPSCRLSINDVKKNGFRAAQLTVDHEPEHAHRHLHHIVDMIDGAQMTERAKDLAKRIFTRLGEAEAKVHGTTIRKVHFHEVGAVDSIADIVGTAIAFDLLAIDRVECSPIPTGRGFIEIAHGRCSVPAPATAELLRGAPLAASDVEAELTTPTGAAIAVTLAERFGPLPAMRVEAIGYGAGMRDLEHQPNLLRVLIGDDAEAGHGLESLVLLETNLDDATGQQLGHCLARLLAAGALDAYTVPIGMKKSRPGVMLCALCRPADVESLELILFQETTTLGVRRIACARRALERTVMQVESPLGIIPGKRVTLPDGSVRFSPEYEDCRRIAAERNLPLGDVIDAARRAFAP